MGSGKYPSMQQEYKERNKGLTELTLEAAGGRKRTHFDACRHRANTLWAVPIVLGDPVVYYVNTAKFRHQAGSDFMSNVRLSLPLRWSALPAANLSDQVLRIMRSLALGGGGLAGAKTVRSPYCYYSYFLHTQRKQYDVIRPQKRKKPFIISVIPCNQDT